MTSTAYVVTRFSDPESLLPAVEALSASESVIRWDAVEGAAHLVLKVRLAGAELPRAVADLPGVAELHRYDIETDDEDGAPRDHALRHAYLYLDTDPELRDEVRTALKQDEHVVFCAPTSGECDLIALLKGETFESVLSFIDVSVRGMSGILRYKHDWVINLTTL